MAKLCSITINGTTFAANAGDRVLDAALLNGIDLPHDCRAGQCGTCLVRLLDGHVLGGHCAEFGAVHACQAHIVSDLTLASDQVPSIDEIDGEIVSINDLVRDVVEVTIATSAPLTQMPGQYARVTFAGYPARNYSPTMALDGSDQPGTFRLHIRRLAEGRVSSRIGMHTASGIGVGHPVIIKGPFGSAFFRPGHANRLVLIASGTGFAPIWAIADSALRENASRAIVVVAGARCLEDLYMAPALQRMSTCPNVTVCPVVEAPQNVLAVVRAGRPADFATLIAPGDIVHAAGAPAMVMAIEHAARAAGVAFHADPFTPSAPERASWVASTKGLLRHATAQRPVAAQARSLQPQFVAHRRW